MDRRLVAAGAVLAISLVLAAIVWRMRAGDDARPGDEAARTDTSITASGTTSIAPRGAATDESTTQPTPPVPSENEPEDEAGAEGAGSGTQPTAEPGGEAAGSTTRPAATVAAAPSSADSEGPPAPPTTGTLNAGSIRDVVRENAGYFRFCFEWELNRHPDLAGRITMAFVIAADGSVREAHVMEDGIENETVTRCFAGVTSRMRFPAPDDGEVTVHYPFILDGAPPAERPAGI